MAGQIKTETVTIRATPAIKRLASRRAAAAHRSLAGHIAHLIEEDGRQAAHHMNPKRETNGQRQHSRGASP